MIIAGASIGASAYVLTRPQPDFQVEDLSLSSDKVAQGEPVTALVEVANVGDAEGTHTVEVEVGGKTLEKEVTLDAGESRTVDFDIEKQEKGTYSLNIEGLSESFEVVEPARFELTNLQVSPKEAEPGEVVTISLDVKNVGGKEGSRTVELNLNSSIEKTRDVTLAPGESTSITFTVQKGTGKSYSVKVGNLSGSFEVLPPSKPTKLKVRIEVDGKILHYNEICAWGESRFNSIMENRAGFESSQIERFNEIYKVNADNFKVKSQEENNSTVFKCDVQDKISTSGDRRTATFLWFLNPLGLDFIEDNFDESKTGLSWSGKINETQMIITIDLPAQDSVYEDWGESVGHCHGHIWWPIQKEESAEFGVTPIVSDMSIFFPVFPLTTS